tara:strand:+ start:249 stop:1448 length:1200 start_codon:yes stop_codon:yes gene_type:complete
MENILFFTPDIRALIQNVHLGPQARVKELIDDFNFRYSRYMKKNLDITKKFYWKPGAYDTIKEVIWFLGDLDKKANSLTKVVQRSKDSHYRLRTLIQYTDVIESLLFDFRSRGMVQQDNTDDAIEAWNVIKNHLSEQVSNMNRFNVYVEPIMLDDELQDYYIHIIYRYDDVVINYEHNQGPRIAEIEIPGEGHLTVKMPLSRLLNNVIYKKFDISKLSNFKYARNENRKWDFRIGGDYHGYDEIQHPYIARDGSWYSQGFTDNFKYVCVGNLESEITACISKLDFISLQIFFDRIMTHYDTQTGPLNQLDTTYHGVPKQLLGNEEFWDIRGMKQSSQCNYPIDDYDDPIWVKEDSYCALFCTLKDECVQYQRNAKELTQQEITQKALEQATLQLARGGR